MIDTVVCAWSYGESIVKIRNPTHDARFNMMLIVMLWMVWDHPLARMETRASWLYKQPTCDYPTIALWEQSSFSYSLYRSAKLEHGSPVMLQPSMKSVTQQGNISIIEINSHVLGICHSLYSKSYHPKSFRKSYFTCLLLNGWSFP